MTAPATPSVAHTIHMRVRDVGQLFNSLDPSPFHERDLDPDAEEFILESARRLPPTALRITVHLREGTPSTTQDVQAALQAFFSREEDVGRYRFSRFLREARRTLMIGLVFLSLCVITATLLVGGGALSRLLAEGLAIAGWVSLWRPMEMLLYDWWPLRREHRLLARLAEAQIEVLAGVTPSAT